MDSAGGIINLYKPVGMTSFSAVSRIRRLTGIKKVGHCGTLDPFAEGVLPVCIGRATAAVQYMDLYDKKYRVEMIFGKETDTQDRTGKVIFENEPAQQVQDEMEKSDFALLRKAVSGLTGTQEQLPPMYSAIKVDGRHLYEFARQGIEIERKTRTIRIYDAALIDISTKDGFRATVDFHCSKGTYIRTLCVHIGRALSFGAYANTLSRTACGPFTLDGCFTLEQIENLLGDKTSDPLDILRRNDCCLPVEFALSHMNKVFLTKDQSLRLIQGQEVKTTGTLPKDGPLLVFCDPDRFVGVARRCGEEEDTTTICAERIFVDVADFK
jgi:tRNA pseudouridine55 synthase